MENEDQIRQCCLTALFEHLCFHYKKGKCTPIYFIGLFYFIFLLKIF